MRHNNFALQITDPELRKLTVEKIDNVYKTPGYLILNDQFENIKNYDDVVKYGVLEQRPWLNVRACQYDSRGCLYDVLAKRYNHGNLPKPKTARQSIMKKLLMSSNNVPNRKPFIKTPRTKKISV
jgi:hypothetical protein